MRYVNRVTENKQTTHELHSWDWKHLVFAMADDGDHKQNI